MTRAGTAAVALVCVLLASACGDGGDGGDDDGAAGGSGSELTVVAEDFSFDPSTIQADPGSTVMLVFDNRDDTRHNFTIDALDVDVVADGGDATDVELAAPQESAEFYCRFHPNQMRGELSVTGAAGPGDDGENGPGDDGEKGDGDTGGGYDY